MTKAWANSNDFLVLVCGCFFVKISLKTFFKTGHFKILFYLTFVYNLYSVTHLVKTCEKCLCLGGKIFNRGKCGVVLFAIFDV